MLLPFCPWFVKYVMICTKYNLFFEGDGYGMLNINLIQPHLRYLLETMNDSHFSRDYSGFRFGDLPYIYVGLVFNSIHNWSCFFITLIVLLGRYDDDSWYSSHVIIDSDIFKQVQKCNGEFEPFNNNECICVCLKVWVFY